MKTNSMLKFYFFLIFSSFWDYTLFCRMHYLSIYFYYVFSESFKCFSLILFFVRSIDAICKRQKWQAQYHDVSKAQFCEYYRHVVIYTASNSQLKRNMRLSKTTLYTLKVKAMKESWFFVMYVKLLWSLHMNLFTLFCSSILSAIPIKMLAA